MTPLSSDLTTITAEINALVVVNSHKADLRNEDLVHAIQRGQNR